MSDFVPNEEQLRNFIENRMKFKCDSGYASFAQPWMLNSDIDTLTPYIKELNSSANDHFKWVLAKKTGASRTCGRVTVCSGDFCFLAVNYEISSITGFEPAIDGGFDEFFGPRQETVSGHSPYDTSIKAKAEPEVEPENEPQVEPENEPQVEPENEPKVEPENEPQVEPENEPKVVQIDDQTVEQPEEQPEEQSVDELNVDTFEVDYDPSIVSSQEAYNTEIFNDLQHTNMTLSTQLGAAHNEIMRLNQLIQALQARIIDLLERE